MNPIEKSMLALCYEIEKLPASEQQTKISIMASDIFREYKSEKEVSTVQDCGCYDSKGVQQGCPNCANQKPLSQEPSLQTHKKVFEYDGSFRCTDCGALWGALPGNPTMPMACKPVTKEPSLLERMAKQVKKTLSCLYEFAEKDCTAGNACHEYTEILEDLVSEYEAQAQMGGREGE